MKNQIIESILNDYNILSVNDFKRAIREISQKIILSGISRSSFFSFAVFYGGTSLRILRNLDRFSEDLDFTLTKTTDKNFLYYLNYGVKELITFGINATISEKEKNDNLSVKTYFIKFNLSECMNEYYHDFKVDVNEIISIKLGIETNYLEYGNFEFKTILFPSFSKIRTYDIQTSFASKLIAILRRTWKNRVKGRDYYDYLFYVSKNAKINFKFLVNGLIKYKLIDKEITSQEFKLLLYNKFSETNYESVIEDINPFIINDRLISAFNKETFLDTIEYLQFE